MYVHMYVCMYTYVLGKKKLHILYPERMRGSPYLSFKEEVIVQEGNMKIYVFQDMLTFTCKTRVKVIIFVKT